MRPWHADGWCGCWDDDACSRVTWLVSRYNPAAAEAEVEKLKSELSDTKEAKSKCDSDLSERTSELSDKATAYTTLEGKWKLRFMLRTDCTLIWQGWLVMGGIVTGCIRHQLTAVTLCR